AENKEIVGVVTAVVTGCFGVLVAMLSKRKTVIHKILTVPAETPPAAPNPLPAEPALPPEGANPRRGHLRAPGQPPVHLLPPPPAYPAVRRDPRTTLDVLVRIIPPERVRHAPRPAVNLGLVLDRSGSMAAEGKIEFAREAAMYAVQQLLPTDRVSVTIFDDKVETLVSNTAASDKARIFQLLRQIKPGGTTALHAAWEEGCQQVSRFPIAGGLNR